MIDWTTIENAIAALVRDGTGLPAVWAEQNAPRPDGAYVAMRVMSVRQRGLDWTTIEDAAPDISVGRQGIREMVLGLQCFAGADAPAGTGPQSPRAKLEALTSYAKLAGQRAALGAAGLGLLGFGPVQSLDGGIGSIFEPRATCEARFLVGSDVAEIVPYIESTELHNQTTGETFTVTRS